MSVAESLENFLLASQKRTGQKKARALAKLKKNIKEKGILFFTPSKRLDSKKKSA